MPYKAKSAAPKRIDVRPERPSAAKRGYDRKWYRNTESFRRLNPLCFECLKNGRDQLGSIVDHIVAHGGNPILFNDPANFQKLCKHHHDKKTMLEQHATEQVKLVYGPPGAGKSTYVDRNRKHGDVVIDTDTLWATFVSEGRFHRDESLWDFIDDALRLLIVSARLKRLRCWAVMGGATQRQRLIVGTNAERLLLDPGRDVCAERIKADPQSAGGVEQRLLWLDQWHRSYEPD